MVLLGTDVGRLPDPGPGPGGLACFLVPRRLPDGEANRIAIERLKDKLGNRSNASAEIEYRGALGWPVGAEGEALRPSWRWCATPASTPPWSRPA